ncbi:uncharacterized protein LOC144923733 isoform X2 [Branchiostoma floridae x Branchiostoma belcheri]
METLTVNTSLQHRPRCRHLGTEGTVYSAVTMWLVNSVKSLRSPREGLPGRPYEADSRPRCTNVLTPETIPEFLIPPTELPSRKRSDSGSNDSEAAYGLLSGEERLLPPGSLPGYAPDSDAWSYVTPPRSPAVSPYRARRAGVVTAPTDTDSLGALGPDAAEMDNNADPLSRMGMTLQHLGRTRTSYGFTTLTQSPTTNRKESLYFHNGRSAKQRGSSPLVITPESDSDSGWSQHQQRRSTGSTPAGSVFYNPSSSESSPVSSPASSRSRRSSGDASSLGKKSPKVPKYVRRQRFQTRRRSSLAVPIDFSSTEPSSTEPSPNVPRKTSPWGGNHLPTRPRSNSLQVPTFTPYALRESNGQDRPVDHYLGELKFAIEFVKRGRQLKVSIIKAENLGGHKHAKNNVNSYIRLYLLPGKVGRQQTRTVKHTRNPIFNEEFYFGGLGLQMLNDMKLRMKVFSKTPHLRRDELLGEVQVVLGTLDLSHENRLWRNLEPKTEAEDLGMLNVSLCYQPRSENLIVTVIKAEDLPRNNILTPPDPYVKIVLSGADGGEDDVRQTRIRRKTSNPVFKEAFSLHIPHDSVKSVSITATVYDHARIISDGVIGQVRFGATATELSEIEHFRKALDQENQPIAFWHNLMEME